MRVRRPDEGRPGLFRPPRATLQRGVIILPSAFTLGNLFFGIYAIVAATREDFIWSAWFIVWAGILDLLDGRVARFTRTGSRFGAELDSLVDAVSFGVAPGLIMYQLYFSDTAWSWTLAFVYVTATVVRLARFNVEQAGHAKTHFHGLPSPTAGMILATYYPFSQTAFFQTYLAVFPWTQIMALTMVLLAVLMVSHVPYPVMPRIGVRNVRGLISTAFIALCLVAAIAVPRYFFFPFLVGYTALGLLRSVILGLVERLPERDPLLDEEEEAQDEADAEIRSLDYTEVAPARGLNRLERESDKESDQP
jgi:CDP-diacylglycerol--serine O-phosphatidyltransferase